MKELQTVALGLIVIFVDLGDPDWVADPLGWLLVLVGIAGVKQEVPDYGYLAVTAWVCLALSVVTWPPDSIPTLDATLGWVFSLPTLAFCYLLADSLYDVTVPRVAQWFRLICWSYALVAVLPLVPLLVDWDWLETPTTVLTIGLHALFVIALFGAAGDDAVPEATSSSASTPTTAAESAKATVAGAATAAKDAAKKASSGSSGSSGSKSSGTKKQSPSKRASD